MMATQRASSGLCSKEVKAELCLRREGEHLAKRRSILLNYPPLPPHGGAPHSGVLSLVFLGTPPLSKTCGLPHPTPGTHALTSLRAHAPLP